jgi:hypothetical protein
MPGPTASILRGTTPSVSTQSFVRMRTSRSQIGCSVGIDTKGLVVRSRCLPDFHQTEIKVVLDLQSTDLRNPQAPPTGSSCSRSSLSGARSPWCRPPGFTFKRTSMEAFTASRRRARYNAALWLELHLSRPELGREPAGSSLITHPHAVCFD